MTSMQFRHKAASLAIIWALLMGPLLVSAQTQIKPPKNKYKIEDDLKLGRETAAEVEKAFPVLNDPEGTRYLQRIGENLVASIPKQFQQPAFNYEFKIINASDINAFALPGGPMYVNRGMIEAAKNEGEMAGVMAHEIAHVALRHGTAQATKRSSIRNQIIGIGAIIGGAVLGGETGAAIGAVLYSSIFELPFSREQETQADILGAQMLAEANYDPNDLANMFRTIEKADGESEGPDWFSTHPAPAKRYENIQRESRLLEVAQYPIKMTPDFRWVQSRLKSMPQTKTLAEFEKDAEGKKPGGGTAGGGSYSSRVEPPSTSTREIRNGSWFYATVPRNWKDRSSGDTLELAPEGAYGDEGITHGMMFGIHRARSSGLYYSTDEYLKEMLRANPYLRRTSSFQRTTVSRQAAYMITFEGVSPITRRNELVTVYTTELRDRDVLYLVTVVPESERFSYNNAFRSVVNSVRLYY